MESLKRKLERIERKSNRNSLPAIVVTGLTIKFCDKSELTRQFKTLAERNEYMNKLQKQDREVVFLVDDINY